MAHPKKSQPAGASHELELSLLEPELPAVAAGRCCPPPHYRFSPMFLCAVGSINSPIFHEIEINSSTQFRRGLYIYPLEGFPIIKGGMSLSPNIRSLDLGTCEYRYIYIYTYNIPFPSQLCNLLTSTLRHPKNQMRSHPWSVLPTWRMSSQEFGYVVIEWDPHL